ncbi:phosphotransferase family protein [Acetobacter orientalis]|uniref:phosphotransferase family protein n=1 Tax=Acetobacter orientalis TaxID=146474 RepID=UPI0039E94423
MSDGALLISEMMRPEAEYAVKEALEHFYRSEKIAGIWPGAISDGPQGRLPLNEVEFIVLPLDRIGAPAGASGASVFVAYYSHIRGTQAASQPLVVKIGTSQKLREEKDGADKWRPKLSDWQARKFAFPLYLEDVDAKHSILLAPFQSLSELSKGGCRNEIEVRDLWHLLDDKMELATTNSVEWDKISDLVSQALEAIQPAHRSGLAQTETGNINCSEQYLKYLRRTTQCEVGGAKYILDSIFGTLPTTKVFGAEWPNPNLVVSRIIEQKIKFNGYIGAIHGDLHPKNIVMDGEGNVQIIDFGWAKLHGHVIIDYVMLDLNLRGVTLPSQISENGILQFANFLRQEDNLDDLPKFVRDRARIIKDVIWKKVRERAILNDWEHEYLIPLFLVGYGLLVHLDKARNQPALVATVLQLAKELDEIIPQDSAS